MYKSNIEEIKYPNTEISDREYCEKIIIKTLEKLENNGISIGEGKTAKVSISELDSNFCVKMVFNKEISTNDVNKEMDFLEQLSERGIPVPKPICSVKTENNDYIFMETIKGVTLEDLDNDVSGDLIEKLPEKFDFKKFFNRIREIVSDLHSLGYYHRDLHAGNIMINSDGEPVIIDFGDAYKAELSSEDPYRFINAKGEQMIFPDDELKINENYRKVGGYLKKFGWFN